ncbi:MAG: IMP dehydrogenase [Candidatus Saccharibacteria bacterium]
MQTVLTFDDVLLKPGYSGFDRSEVDLSTQLTQNIRLATPLVSSPMDTVTEHKLAIALAKAGGIGFIHRNLTIKDQAAEVASVKKLQLLVGAAVGASPGFEERTKQLVTAGADVILVDCAHGHSKKVIAAVSYIKSKYDVDVVAGSVATAAGAEALIAAGADALRVGMGPAAICTTRIVSGMGVPQLSAIQDTVAIARTHNIPVIADGGISYSGDITKALAAGASCVMLGKLFAATIESPSHLTKLKAADVPLQFSSILDGSATYQFKEHRGMGSLASMQRGLEVNSEDEFHGKNYTGDVLVPEGVSGIIPCSGPVANVVAQLMGGVTSGMYYVGAPNIPKLWQVACFLQITSASLSESHPHHLHITH